MPALCVGKEKQAELLVTMLRALPTVKRLCIELSNDLETSHRQIFVIDGLPRVCVQDFRHEINFEVLQATLELDKDSTVLCAAVAQACMNRLDKFYEGKLASQRCILLRDSWCRFESDKWRLLLSYLVRQCRRSPMSYRGVLIRIWNWHSRATLGVSYLKAPITPYGVIVGLLWVYFSVIVT